ncbi:MAG TPA: peptidylprolyl isomerase [Vicinamibacterales bacterium]|nr:peptidylprolyl isomerase [Vicinamibacterales bacterium]
MKKGAIVVALALLVAAPARGEIIDRILATVGTTLILQSDAVAAVRLGFVRVPPGQQDALQWAMDRLVERRLMLIEVERYGPPEPTLAEIDARMTRIDADLRSGQRLEEILREAGLSVGQLRGWVRDELRLEAYLRQRFGATFAPTEDELVRYYRDHEAEFTVDGRLRPFGEVRDRVRAAVAEQRREAAIREWLASLRRRTDVNILYLPAR